MTDLFTSSWTKTQLEALHLDPADPRYEQARQAADRGWPAARIAKLLRLDRSHDDER